jgi:hypothetical protein
MNFLTLIVCEVPLLYLRLLKLEVLGRRLSSSALLRDSKCEALIQGQSDELGAVPGLVDFQTDVKVLPSQKVGPVGD